MTLEHEQAASTWLLMRLFVSSDKLAHHCRGGHIRPESCFAGGGCPQFIDSFYDRPSSGTKSITMIPSQHKRDSPSVARYFHRARSGSHYRTVRPRTISAAVTAQPAGLVGYDPASASRINLSGLDRLETEMSSSISSQWIPIPSPMNSHSFLCFSVAFKSRGNQTNGTVTVRPSSSTTVNASLKQETSTAIASLLLTEVCIPSLHEKISILFDESTNDHQFVTSETTVGRQIDGIKPKFRIRPECAT